MKQHSPWPWTYDPVEPAIRDANGNVIADLQMFTQENQEMPCDANGHLMAAAPMLRSTLRTFITAKTLEELKDARRFANKALREAQGWHDDDE